MIEKFIDFMMGTGPEDIVDPIKELRSFGICEVGAVVDLEGIHRDGVNLNWSYLEEEHGARMHIYSKQGKYKKGDKVQIIEARRGFDQHKEGFNTTLHNPLMGELQTLTHYYLARPMENRTDLLTDQDLDPETNIVAELDNVSVTGIE